MKRRMFVEVSGRSSLWMFEFYGDPAHLADWRADGLEVNEIVGTVPLWVARIGLARPWVAAQDAWQWLRVW